MADDFNPEALLQALDRHRVTFVLIGGYAAQLHGARRPTEQSISRWKAECQDA